MRHLASIWLALAFLASPLGPTASAQQRPLDAVEGDRIRIRAHLAQVEDELRAADTAHLDPAQRAARAEQIAQLRAYRMRGEFPHGSATQPGLLAPTFIDSEGRACAMGALVIASGHRDVAEAIARDQNHARVPAIVHPALGPWLEAHGMTLAEAARVQPTYCWERCRGDAGPAQPVCATTGTVYTSACVAECEREVVAGPASCDDAGMCTCPDAGASADAGSPDAAVPRLDAGPGGSVSPGGCSATHARGSAAWIVGIAIALGLIRRRR